MLLRTKKRKFYEKITLKAGTLLRDFTAYDFYHFQSLDIFKTNLHTKFQDSPCSGSRDIDKNMQKIGEKKLFLTTPYKLSKNRFRTRLKCSDFDGTTTICLQIRSSFRIATDTGCETTGNGLYSV